MTTSGADESKKLTDTAGDFRKDIRTGMSSEVSIAFDNKDSWYNAEIINLSFGGVKILLKGDNYVSSLEPGRICEVKVDINKKETTFPGKVVWVSSGSPEGETGNGTEAGIQFEGLSVDDKADLISFYMWNKYENNSGLQE